MKLTIEIDTAKGEHKSEEAIALLGGSVFLALLGDDMVAVRTARDEARKVHAEKTVDPGTAPAGDETEDPRAYGEPSGDRKRRTKAEMAIDEEIEALFTKASDAGVAGLPGSIPTDTPAEDLLAELKAMDIPEPDFDLGDEDGSEDEEADEILDIEEFRAIMVKASKKIGNAALAKIMAPHKNPGQVPEGERRDYADRIIEAMET